MQSPDSSLLLLQKHFVRIVAHLFQEYMYLRFDRGNFIMAAATLKQNKSKLQTRLNKIIMKDSNYESGSNFGKVLTAILAGAAIGAAAGVLFAPKKGSETRDNLSKKAKEVGDQLRSKKEDLKDKAKDKADEIRSAAHNVGEKIEDRKSEMAGAAKNGADQIKSQSSKF